MLKINSNTRHTYKRTDKFFTTSLTTYRYLCRAYFYRYTTFFFTSKSNKVNTRQLCPYPSTSGTTAKAQCKILMNSITKNVQNIQSYIFINSISSSAHFHINLAPLCYQCGIMYHSGPWYAVQGSIYQGH